MTSVGAQVFADCVVQAVADEGDREVRDVYANPAAVEALGGGDRSSAAAERVEHDIALVAGCTDDAFEQGFGLLSGVA